MMLRKLGLGVVIAGTLLGVAGASAEELVLHVTRAEVASDVFSGGPTLHVWLTPEARKAFAAFTLEHVGDKTDMIVNGDVLSSPVIQTVIDTEMVVLSGVDSFVEAQEMAALLSHKKATISVRLSTP
jgi:preprotein translocase subunit SecD